MVHATVPPHPASSSVGSVIRYRIEGFSDDWIIPEVPVPEAVWHDRCLELLKALLAAWIARSNRAAFVFRDIAIGVKRDRPKVGFNPDVCVVQPVPVSAEALESLKLWEEGASPPIFAFEAVSRNHPYKDYTTTPEKCAVVGVGELVVFDPLLAGPRAQGGPWLLQVWRRAPEGAFERVYAGSDPAWSDYLGAYLIPDEASAKLRIADDRRGERLWLTFEEQARKSEEQARRSEEQARRSEEQARKSEREALARVAELEAELRRRGGGG